MTFFCRIVFCLMLLTAAGCGAPPLPLPGPVHKAPFPEPLGDDTGSMALPVGLLETAYEYHLGAGDIIELFANSVPEINRKYVIGPDGWISVPGVGGVNLTQKTRAEAEQAVTDLLERNYREPRVTVLVAEYNNNRIYVLGEVRKPGEYNFAGRPTLLGALSRAEGLTSSADMRSCKVVRGKGMLLSVNLYDLLEKGNRSLNLALQPNDTVFVSANEANLFYVLGEVERPGVFALGEKMDAVRAIAMAGGPTEDAVLSEVRVVRQAEAAAQVFVVNFERIVAGRADSPPETVRSNDIIYVPRKALASFNYVLRQVTPSLNLLLLGDSLRDLGDD